MTAVWSGTPYRVAEAVSLLDSGLRPGWNLRTESPGGQLWPMARTIPPTMAKECLSEEIDAP